MVQPACDSFTTSRLQTSSYTFIVVAEVDELLVKLFNMHTTQHKRHRLA